MIGADNMENKMNDETRLSRAAVFLDQLEQLEAAISRIRYYASEHDPVCGCNMCEIFHIVEQIKEKQNER